MSLISPIDKTLSLEARGVLAVMLNDIFCDYCSLEYLYKIFPQESKTTIKNTLSELCEKNYVIEFKPFFFAVNKKKIPKMIFVGGNE